MASFSSRGDVRWKTEILDFPISAQFTPDGHLIFITQIGRIYVLRRDSGELVLPVVEMIPGMGYTPAPQDYDDCLSGSTEVSPLEYRSGVFPPRKFVSLQ